MVIKEGQSLEEAFQAVSQHIRRGALDKRHPFRFVTLATQGPNTVGLRYVVLRKVVGDLEPMIYTDHRSEKVSHMAKNQRASLLFYHPSEKLQVRLEGEAHIHHLDETASEEWHHVQGDARRAYGSIAAPGVPIATPEEAHNWPQSIDQRYFAVLRIVPDLIEALQLNQLAHYRAQFTNQNSSWEGQWLVP